MPKIQLIQSQRTAPASTGQRFAKADTRVADAIQGAGNLLKQAADRRQEKQASASLFEIENELRTTSRESYIDAQENRLGKNALPDEDAGYAGVYEDYNQTADKFIAERVAKLPARYQQAATERLTGISNGYRDRFAIHQSAQEAEHRKAVLASNLDNIKDDLYMDMRVGGDVSRIAEGFTELEETVKAESRGKDVSAFLAQTKADLYKQSILAKSDSDPHSALEMLKEKAVLKALDPDQVTTLEGVIDKKRIDAEAKVIISNINQSTLSYESKLELAQESSPDPEVQKMVVTQINWQKKQADNAESETQYNIMDETYDAVFGKQEKISPTAIDTDPSYAILSPTQKITVKSWLGGGKAGEMPTGAREMAWFEASRKIIKGEWTEYNVMAEAGKTVDIRDIKSLVGFARSETSSPQTYNNVTAAFKALYPKQYDNDKKRSQIMYAVMADASQFKADNGNEPNRAQLELILKDNAKGFVEGSFWNDPPEVDALQEAYPNITEAQYKFIAEDSDEPRVDFRERETIRYRQGGFPQAYYSSAAKLYDLGQPETNDGFHYYIFDGKRYSIEVGSPEYKEFLNQTKE